MRRRRHRVDESRLEQLLADAASSVPPPTEEDLRNLAREAAAFPRTPIAAGDGRRPLYVRWAVAMTTSALLVGGFGFGLGSWRTPTGVAGTNVVGVGFLSAKGWTVVQSETSAPPKSSIAIASNVRIDARVGSSELPYAALRRLPPRGIVIVARLSPRGDEKVDGRFSLRTLPLRVQDAVAVALPRSLAQSALVPVRVRAGVNGFNADVTVFFGGTPSLAMFAAVDQQLRGLVVAGGVALVVSPQIIRSPTERLSIFGSVSSGKADEKVTIQFRQCGLRPLEFRDRLETTTREGGGYSFAELRPVAFGISGVLRAVSGASVSAQVSVQQHASVYLQPVAGGRFEVLVTALQQFWRRQVQLQRFERRLGRWTTVRTLVLTEQLGGGGPAPPFASASPITTKTAPFRPRLPKGTTIRAVFPLSQAKPCYLAGYSNQLRT